MKKTDGQIRAYIDDLKLCRETPCNCAASGHEIECEMGRVAMLAIIDGLTWALGESKHHDAMVSHTAQYAASIKKARKK